MLKMKTRNGLERTCSCSSCLAKAELERSIFKKLSVKGSKANRVYDGIPREERKLLEKLVRTRAIYDDIRAKLLSNSTLDSGRKAYLLPTKGLKQNSAILGLIDLVDRGIDLKSSKSHECCSCCSCSSKIIDHGYADDILEVGTVEDDFYDTPFNTYPREYLREYYKRRKKNVKFEPKFVKSDPCTCTLKFRGLMERASNSLLKKLRPESSAPDLEKVFTIMNDEVFEIDRRRRLKNLSKASYQKIKDSSAYVKDKMIEGARKLSESKTYLEGKLLQGKQKLTRPLRKSRNSKYLMANREQTNKENIKRKNSRIKCFCPDSLVSKIRKDSISKFRKNLQKKRDLKQWECEQECNEKICNPKECFENLNFVKWRLNKPPQHIDLNLTYNENIGDTINSVPEYKKEFLKIMKPPGNRDKKSRPTGTSIKKKKTAVQCDCELASNQNVARPIKDKSLTNISKLNEQFSGSKWTKKNDVPNIMTSGLNLDFGEKQKNVISKTSLKKRFKQKHVKRNNQFRDNILKRCFCILKLKPKKNLTEKLTKGSETYKFSNFALQYGDINKNHPLSSCLMDQSICKNNICDSNECDNILTQLSNRKTMTKFKPHIKINKKPKVACKCFVINTGGKRNQRLNKYASTISGKRKSTSNLISTVPIKPYLSDVDNLTNRRVVKISSSIKFGIEFYKDNTGDRVTSKSTIPLEPKHKLYHDENNLKYKPVETQMYPDRLSELTEVTIKKCFCNLKLLKKRHRKQKQKLLINTDIDDTKKVQMVNKSTKINQNYLSALNSHICDTTCITDLCYPNICLRKINKHYIKRHSVVCACDPPKQNSVYSTTDNNKSSKQIQSKLLLQNKKTAAYLKKNDNVEQLKPKCYGPEICNKNSVKLVSTLSFTLEFSKTKIPNKKIDSYESIAAHSKKIRKKNKEASAKYTRPNLTNDNSQVNIKRRHQSTLVNTMLKRCFCTLNLAKNRRVPGYNHPFNKLNTSLFAPNIYTVNRVLTSNVKFFKYSKSPLKLIESSHFSSSNPSICSKIEKKKYGLICTQSEITYKHIDKDLIYAMHSRSLKSVSFRTHVSEIKKQQHIKFNSYTKLALSVCSKDRRSTEKESLTAAKCADRSKTYASKKKNSLKIKRSHNKTSKINLSNICTYQTVTGISRCWQKCYCTMTLQTKHHKKNIENIRKLEPYECEPGVCVPGECNPYECQKLILKRLQRSVTKSISAKFQGQSKSTDTPTTKVIYKDEELQPIVTKSRRKQPGTRYSVSNAQRKAVRIGSSFSCNIEFYKNRNPKQKHIISKTLGTSGKKGDYMHKSSQAKVQRSDKVSKTLSDRCFCTLKLQKKGLLHSKQNSTKTPIHLNVKPVVKYETKAQNTKVLKNIYQLAPYECEPGICVPGNCDPYKCLEIMNKRKLMNSGTITELRNKSAFTLTDEHIAPRNRRSQATNKSYKRKPRRTRRRVRPKQRVRIASSFDFNIEFFKEAPAKDNVDTMITDKNKSSKVHSKSAKTTNKKNIGTRDNKLQKLQKNMGTQDSKLPAAVSTMTDSLSKRCFCTAKLFGTNKRHLNEPRNNMFKNFLRFLKLRCYKKKPTNKKLKPKTSNKGINTKTNAYPPVPIINVRECEPGICIPGECDPRVCYEIMNKKKLKDYSTSTFTKPVKRKQVKNFNNDRLFHNNIHTQSQKLTATSPPEYRDRKKQSGKQVVRIGSNFSFNIEFHKQVPKDGGDDFKTPNEAHKDKFDENKVLRKTKNIGLGSRPQYFDEQTQGDQVYKDRAVNVKPFLDRCFCTLKLKNRENESEKAKPVDTISRKIQTVKTKPIKLLPYECEPHTCIPGECNPWECLERIKMRNIQTKNVGQLTNNNYNKSRPDKNRKTQTKKIKNEKLEAPKHYQTVSDVVKFKQPNRRQVVRLGSNCSFNIEFCKSNITKDVNKNNTYKGGEYKEKEHKALQDQKSYRSDNTQSNMINTKSVMSSVAPVLKRCFCTLQLQKDAQKSNNTRNPKLKLHVLSKQKRTSGLNETNNFTNQRLQTYYCGSYGFSPDYCQPCQCYLLVNCKNNGADALKNTKVGNSAKTLYFSESHTQQSKTKDSNHQMQCSSTKNITNMNKFTTKCSYYNIKKSINTSGIISKRKRLSNLFSMIRTLSKLPNINIASNLSFNIELYNRQKHMLLIKSSYTPKKLLVSDPQIPIEKSEKFINKIKKSLKDNKNLEAQGDSIKINSKNEIRLKRCSSTLNFKQDLLLKRNQRIHRLFEQRSVSVFPQVFDVRRVNIIHSAKPKLNKNKNPTSTCKNLMYKPKYIKLEEAKQISTILPYRPSEFTKASSKILLFSTKNRIYKNNHQTSRISENRQSDKVTKNKLNFIQRIKNLYRKNILNFKLFVNYLIISKRNSKTLKTSLTTDFNDSYYLRKRLGKTFNIQVKHGDSIKLLQQKYCGHKKVFKIGNIGISDGSSKDENLPKEIKLKNMDQTNLYNFKGKYSCNFNEYYKSNNDKKDRRRVHFLDSPYTNIPNKSKANLPVPSVGINIICHDRKGQSCKVQTQTTS